MDKEQSNRSFWERFAFLYSPFMRRNRKQYIATYGRCQKYLKGLSVLEIACGTGQYTSLLAGDAARIEATDFSAKMVERARKKVRAENVNFAVRDGTDLPYADGSFDGVFIANALHIMPDPARALSEISRVLKAGGMLFAPTFVYDGVRDGRKMRIAEKFGFRTFHKWKSDGFSSFVSSTGFEISECEVVAGKLLPECVLIAVKR